MPDGLRERFEPAVGIEPRPTPPTGSIQANTPGLDNRKLAALNRALDQLMRAGLSEHDAKVKLDHAVRAWLEPIDAGTAELDRLRLGHEGTMTTMTFKNASMGITIVAPVWFCPFRRATHGRSPERQLSN